MRKTIVCKRIFAAMLCIMLMMSVLPASVWAAKENFTTCGRIGIRNCAAPVAGQKPDFDVSAYSPGQYEIMSINWFKGSVAAKNSLSSTSTFEYDTVYIVEFEVWAKSAYTFETDSNGNTTVIADVGSGAANGEYTASVWNVYGKENTKYLTVRCTFPATERNVTIINTLAITGVEEPYAGDRAKYPVGELPASVQYLTDNRGYYYDVAWYDSTKKMTNQEYFEEGKTYTCHLAIKAKNGYEFKTDPNHFFSSPGFLFPTVTATINGKDATVMADKTVASGSEVIIVAAQFKCKPSRKITTVAITDLTEPKTDDRLDCTIKCGENTYTVKKFNNFAYKDGVAWLDKNGNFMSVNSDTFSPSTTYTVEILLEAVDPYVFSYTQQGAAIVTATVNGNEAVVSASKEGEKYLIVRYTFRKTTGLEVKKVEINDLEEPKSGNLPDYTITYGDTTYTERKFSDEFTVNGVQWYNETTRKEMRPGVDKFEGGNTYCVYIFLKTTGKYTFEYIEDTDSWKVSAKLNGKTAETEEVFETDMTVWYQYTLPEDVHVCSPQKVNEVKATCSKAGKQEYYFCSECQGYFEDSKCTKKITDINTWGVIPMLEHTGGKATCEAPAVCKNCGESYGELAAHNYGSGWDYKDATGHAHKCKTCGAHDTVEPHAGGTAECGKLAKCAECKTEYGEVMQHQWSEGWEHTDKKGHAHKCTVCGEHDTVQEHTPGAAATETTSQNCTVCNYVLTPATQHKHKMTKVSEVKATCTEAGKEQHYVCEGCGKLFSDSKGTKEVADTESLIIPAKGHKESRWKYNEDSHWKGCTVKGCGEIIADTSGEHDYDKNNKCTVCGYKQGGAVDDVIETTDAETGEIAESEETGKAEETGENTETTPDPDTDKDIPDASGMNSTVMWIVVAAAVVVVVVCVVVTTVVLVKKNTKHKS